MTRPTQYACIFLTALFGLISQLSLAALPDRQIVEEISIGQPESITTEKPSRTHRYTRLVFDTGVYYVAGKLSSTSDAHYKIQVHQDGSRYLCSGSVCAAVKGYVL